MRKIGFVLALLSAISMTAAPAFAAPTPEPSHTSKQHKRAAGKQAVAMLLPNQLEELARLDPALHDKVMKAKANGKKLIVTPTEGAVLAALSQKAEDEISAGAVDWLLVGTAIFAVVSYVIDDYNLKETALAAKENRDPRLLPGAPFWHLVKCVMFAFFGAKECTN